MPHPLHHNVGVNHDTPRLPIFEHAENPASAFYVGATYESEFENTTYSSDIAKHASRCNGVWQDRDWSSHASQSFCYSFRTLADAQAFKREVVLSYLPRMHHWFLSYTSCTLAGKPRAIRGYEPVEYYIELP